MALIAGDSETVDEDGETVLKLPDLSALTIPSFMCIITLRPLGLFVYGRRSEDESRHAKKLLLEWKNRFTCHLESFKSWQWMISHSIRS